MPHRINIIGTSGSGKTTLAAKVAAVLNVPHIELDALNWGPNWTERPRDVFEQAVREAAAQDQWVICGNYNRVRQILWDRATLIVWLDYPKWLVVWRVVARTLRRVFLRTELWSGNRERLLTNMLGRDSIILWAITTHEHRQQEYTRLFEQPAASHPRLIRLRSPRETEAWLARLRRSHLLACARDTPTHVDASVVN